MRVNAFVTATVEAAADRFTMKANAKLTIYDVARRANASPSTVSAALNGSWKARRISAETVERIQQVALELGYSANLQARGLRKARSGLVGMILPAHDNRFFAALSQAFTAEARARDQVPVIISTQRDALQEADAVRRLVGYAVDAIMFVGTTAPSALSALCREAGVAHVFVDQPSAEAPSVVSDNVAGVRGLALALLDRARPDAAAGIVFLGGDDRLYATAQRIKGFREALASHGRTPSADQIIACGYRRDDARKALANLYHRLGGLPPALLVNSIDCLEGALEFLKEIPDDAIAACHLGVWDHDPLGELWRFPVLMVRQRAGGLVRHAYRSLDRREKGATLTLIEPELIVPPPPRRRRPETGSTQPAAP